MAFVSLKAVRLKTKEYFYPVSDELDFTRAVLSEGRSRALPYQQKEGNGMLPFRWSRYLKPSGIKHILKFVLMWE